MISCVNKQNSGEIKVNVKVEKDSLSFIHPNLLKEIKDFSGKDFSGRYLELNVIVVCLFEKDNECEIIIFPNPYYLENLDGYTIIDDKMVAFYYNESCIKNWIKIDSLITIPPKDYFDSNSDIAQSVFDPRGKIFKANNTNMTLELIYDGNF